MSRWQVKSVEESLLQNVLRDIHNKDDFVASMSVLADWYEENNNPKRSAAWRFIAKHERIPANSGFFSWCRDDDVLQLDESQLQATIPTVWYEKLVDDPSIEKGDEKYADLLPWKCYRKRKTALEEVITAYEKLSDEETAPLLAWTLASVLKQQKRAFREHQDKCNQELMASGEGVSIRSEWMSLMRDRVVNINEVFVMIFIEDHAKYSQTPVEVSNEQLGTHTNLSPARVQKIINKMRENHFIIQTISEDGRRLLLTDPTAGGSIEFIDEDE